MAGKEESGAIPRFKISLASQTAKKKGPLWTLNSRLRSHHARTISKAISNECIAQFVDVEGDQTTLPF